MSQKNKNNNENDPRKLNQQQRPHRSLNQTCKYCKLYNVSIEDAIMKAKMSPPSS